MSRNTIRKYLKDSSPPSYHRQVDPVRHKLCDYEERLQTLFEQDLKRPRRERRTGVKLYEQDVVARTQVVLVIGCSTSDLDT